MKTKTNIRYLGFRSTIDGSRLFDFSVSGVEDADSLISFEIPVRFFTGIGHVRFQDGVGICYEKLKHLIEDGSMTEVPDQVSITASDMEQYKESLPTFKRKPPAPDGSDWKIT